MNLIRKRKINIKTIGLLFIIILLLTLFFSKTIYTYDLSTVTATLPKNGKLSKKETATGIANWADIEEIYLEVGGKVEEISVEEGEEVSEGQEMMRFSFDRDEVNRKLKEFTINRNKIAVDIENIHMKIHKTNDDMAELEKESYEKETISDYELKQIEAQIAKAEEVMEKSRILYESGGISEETLDNAKYDLLNLYEKHENLKETYEENEEKAREALEDQEKERSKKLKDYQDDLKAFNQDLKAKDLELKNITLQEETYHSILSEYDEYTVIYAPKNSTIISIPIKTGQTIQENQLIVSFGVGKEYEIESNISLDNNFVTVGDTCQISNASHETEGIVTKITPAENGKQVLVSIQSDEIRAGETFEVTFEKESSRSYTLVPNGAVNKDNDGYYLYQIKQREGILGKEYYVEKLRVYIGDSDSENTVITGGVNFFDPIVLLSDKLISENLTVKVGNEEDFFEE